MRGLVSFLVSDRHLPLPRCFAISTLFKSLGKDRVSQALGDAALLLESIVDHALEGINQCKRLDEIVHTLGPKIPPGLLEKPYLRPVYDEPEFIVHNGGFFRGT